MENLMLDDPAFTTRMVSTLSYLSSEPAFRASGLLLSASVAMRDNLLALFQFAAGHR
jgi:hypothetical protein